MSRKNLIDDLEVKTRDDVPGLPEKEHQKKLAKADAKRKKQKAKDEASQEFWYTQRGPKILILKVTKSGAYTSYFGNQKKLGGQYETLVKKWEKEGKWVPEHQFQSFCSQKLAEVSKRK